MADLTPEELNLAQRIGQEFKNVNSTIATKQDIIDILPVEQGGLGNPNGISPMTEKLSVARKITLSGEANGEVIFNGESDVNISVGLDLSKVKGHILPDGHRTQDLGSPEKRFRKIYVDEAMLSINTLYIGDTPILGTSADTIMIKADPDQSIQMKTSGIGVTQIQSASGVEISTSGMNSDVKIQATGSNSKVRLGGDGGVEINSPLNIQQNATIAGNLTVSGSLILNGPLLEVNATTVSTKDNILVINKGEAGSGVTAGRAGIQVDRGDEADYLFIFDETTDKFVIGTASNLEVVSTRNYVDAAVSNLVTKEIGKGLSTNDFTDNDVIDLAWLKSKIYELGAPTTLVILS